MQREKNNHEKDSLQSMSDKPDKDNKYVDENPATTDSDAAEASRG